MIRGTTRDVRILLVRLRSGDDTVSGALMVRRRVASQVLEW
jgi:hypothetical protein